MILSSHCLFVSLLRKDRATGEGQRELHSWLGSLRLRTTRKRVFPFFELELFIYFLSWTKNSKDGSEHRSVKYTDLDGPLISVMNVRPTGTLCIQSKSGAHMERPGCMRPSCRIRQSDPITNCIKSLPSDLPGSICFSRLFFLFRVGRLLWFWHHMT